MKLLTQIVTTNNRNDSNEISCLGEENEWRPTVIK